jgi:hypothetical protein
MEPWMLLVVLAVIGLIILLIGINKIRPTPHDPDEGILEAGFGKIAANKQAEHVEANTRLVTSLTANSNAHKAHQDLPITWEIEEERKRNELASLALQRINIENEQRLAEVALQNNMATYQLQEVAKELLLKKGLIELEGLANTINQRKVWGELVAQIESAIRAHTIPQLEEIKSIQTDIDRVIEEIAEIEASKEPGWERKVKEREEDLEYFRSLKNERRRPVQAKDGKDNRGTDKDSNHRRDARRNVEEDK